MTNHARNSCLVAIVAVYAHSLSGCATQPFSAAYATVPVQFVVAAGGHYEIVDRPDLGRLVIATRAAGSYHLDALVTHVRDILPFEFANTDRAISPGSAYFDPLMQYFAQTARSCRLIRGRPLIGTQWEFAYSCSPDFDSSAITWKPAGFSNAPIPPRR